MSANRCGCNQAFSLSISLYPPTCRVVGFRANREEQELGESLPCSSEADIFAALELDFVPFHMRSLDAQLPPQG